MWQLVDVRDLDEFARAVQKRYIEYCENYYEREFGEMSELGVVGQYFPIATTLTGQLFAIVFVQISELLFCLVVRKPDTFAERYVLGEDEGFPSSWTSEVPYDQQMVEICRYLDVAPGLVLLDGRTYLDMIHHSTDDASTSALARDIGKGLAQTSGSMARRALPRLWKQREHREATAEFQSTYEELQRAKSTPQRRGRVFELLWRNILEFYEWQPRKIRISGEESDFTAILNGTHILGEVRWFRNPMTGGKMREFLAKLDPRPQTVGLFISYSGFDDGARSVIRRSVNTKTVVLFDRSHIDDIIVERRDPGVIFNSLLRSAYDYVFESVGDDQL